MLGNARSFWIKISLNLGIVRSFLIKLSLIVGNVRSFLDNHITHVGKYPLILGQIITHFGSERGRHGSPRADTQGKRSHGYQEGFGMPPGLPGYHFRAQIDKKDNKNLKSKKI